MILSLIYFFWSCKNVFIVSSFENACIRLASIGTLLIVYVIIIFLESTLNLSQLHEKYRKYSDSSNERNKTHLFISFVFLYQLHYLKNTEAFMMLYFIIVWLISKQEWFHEWKKTLNDSFLQAYLSLLHTLLWLVCIQVLFKDDSWVSFK